MDLNEIIAMGYEAGLCDEEGRDDNSIIITNHMTRFAKLVAAKEREACAVLASKCNKSNNNGTHLYIADAIRDRSCN